MKMPQWYQRDSNQRHMDFQSIALPTELWYLRCFASAKIQLFFILQQKKIFFLKFYHFSLIISIFAKKRMSLILTIDIGNTRAKYAVFDKENIIKSSTFNPYNNDLKQLTEIFPQIKRCIISSVGGKIEECKKQLQDIEIITLTDNIPLPFKIDYNKGQVGSDRLVAVASAMREKPNQNCLVIDIGTCITYDIITSDNIYHGGPISPGINLRFKAMNEYTEKLPLIENYQQATSSKQYENIICNSTKECLVSGVMNGILYEIEGFIKRFSNIYEMLNVFVIGGDNIFFENKLKNCIFADANFTFKGLRYILNYQ